MNQAINAQLKLDLKKILVYVRLFSKQAKLKPKFRLNY